MAIDIVETQKALLSAGYNAGVVDGAWGESTATALLSYTAGHQPGPTIRSLGHALGIYLPKSGVMDTVERLADYLAQTWVETSGYTLFEENMRYTAVRLMQVWPSRFKSVAQAQPYAGSPMALANLVYGDRMGNQLNGTDDNDGWDYRGSGLVMHTGESEYTILKDQLGVTPDQVHHDPTSQVKCSLNYWARKDVVSYVDKGDLTGARRAVNGGTIGLADVNTRRLRILKVLK